jgi:hypothetical protein
VVVDTLIEEEVGPAVCGRGDVKRSRRDGSYYYYHHKYHKRCANRKADSQAEQSEKRAVE